MAWHPCMQHTTVRTGPAYTVRTAVVVGVVVQLYAYTAVRTYCGLYGEGRSAGVATLLVEVSLGRYRTATRLYGYYRLLLDVSSRLDLVRWDSTWTGVFW